VALTQKRIEKLTTPGRYSDGHGLYLQVQSRTNKSWLFRYTFNGRERFMGLGPLHTIDLEEARERARQARKALLDGAATRRAGGEGGSTGLRSGSHHHLRGGSGSVLQRSRGQLEKRETPAAIFEHAEDLRLSQDRQVASCRY
jgi:hypothetical protein